MNCKITLDSAPNPNLSRTAYSRFNTIIYFNALRIMIVLHQSHVYGIDMYACKDVFHSFRAVYICMCSFSIVNLPAAIFDAIFVVCDPPLQPWEGNSKQPTPWKSQTTHAMEIPMRVVPPPSLLTSISGISSY